MNSGRTRMINADEARFKPTHVLLLNTTKSDHAHNVFVELQCFILAFSLFKFLFLSLCLFPPPSSRFLSAAAFFLFLPIYPPIILLCFNIPFPSFFLSHFYPISNFHFPLMKLDEDYDYVWFPNLIRLQLCAGKILNNGIICSVRLLYIRTARFEVTRAEDGCSYALTDIKEDIFVCTWDGFWYVLIKHLYPSHSYNTWHSACKLYVWEDLWWAVC